jgi:positive regulator of sigma E activity
MLNREEIIEEGIVESFTSGTVMVKITRKGACDSCSAKVFCVGNNDENMVNAATSYPVKKGDQVKISIPSKNITSASTYMYGIPLILLMAGLIIGHYIFTNTKEIFSALLALGLIVLYGGIIYFYSKRKDFSSLMPRIIFVKKK